MELRWQHQNTKLYICTNNSLDCFHCVPGVLNSTGWAQVWCFSSVEMDTGNLICDLQCLLEIIEGYKDSSKNKRGIFHCFIAVVEFKCGQSFQVAWGFSGIISASCTTLCNESHTTHLPGPAPRLMWVAEWSFLQHLQYMCLSCFWQSLWNIGIFHGVFGFQWNIWNIPASGIFPWCVNSQGVNIPLDNSLVPVRVNVLLFFLNHKYIHEGNLKKKKKILYLFVYTAAVGKRAPSTPTANCLHDS